MTVDHCFITIMNKITQYCLYILFTPLSPSPLSSPLPTPFTLLLFSSHGVAQHEFARYGGTYMKQMVFRGDCLHNIVSLRWLPFAWMSFTEALILFLIPLTFIGYQLYRRRTKKPSLSIPAWFPLCYIILTFDVFMHWCVMIIFINVYILTLFIKTVSIRLSFGFIFWDHTLTFTYNHSFSLSVYFLAACLIY